MKIEIMNIKEYNPEYRKDGSMVWKKIGEPTGKKGKRLRSKKQYPLISMDKIIANIPFQISENILQLSRDMYNETKEMIPVYLSYDFRLIGGFEQYELAKELQLQHIPFQRVTKMNRHEQYQFQKNVQNRPIGNKKYPIKVSDGSTIFVSMNHAKKVRETKRMANQIKGQLAILPDYTFTVMDKAGNYIIGNDNKGLSFGAIRKAIKKRIGQLDAQKKATAHTK